MADSPDLRTQLAAYLAGELDDASSELLEARMVDEPWVAREADKMADMLVGLADVDGVEPPDGLGQRLRAGLAAEIGHALPGAGVDDGAADEAHEGPASRVPDAGALTRSGAAAATGWSTPPRRDRSRPGTAGQRHRRDRTRWLAAVATVAVLFLGSTAVLRLASSSDDSASDTVDSAAEVTQRTAEDGAAPLALEAAPADDAEVADDELAADETAVQAGAAPADEAVAQDEDAELAAGTGPADAASSPAADSGPTPAPEPAEGAEDSVASGPAEGEEEAAADSAAPAAGPETVQLREVGTDPDAIRDAVGGRAAAQALVGQDASDVRELARSYTDEILRAPDFDEGTSPGECLSQIRREAGPDAIPTVAALLQDGDETRLAYALLRSTDDETLDQLDIWVTDPGDCSVIAVVS